MILNVGSLKKVISIQEAKLTDDGSGGFTTSWTTVKGLSAIRAAVLPIRAQERIEALKIDHEVTHRFIVRYSKLIKPKMRILYDQRYFDIDSIINQEERDRALEIIATESAD